MKCHKILEKIALVIALSLAACAHQESFEEGGGLGEFAAGEENAELAMLPEEGGTDDLLGMPMEGELGGGEAAPQDIELGDFSDPTLGAQALPEDGSLMMEEVASETDPIVSTENEGTEMATMDSGLEMAPVEPAMDTQPELMVDAEPEISAPMSIEPMDSQPEEMMATPDYAATPAQVTKPRKRLKAPLVAEKPFTRHGDSLNRFYMVRFGDTQESVAQLLLGDSGLTTQLSKWNPAASWKTGTIVYYSSPNQGDDGEMRSFQEERGVVANEYAVKPGESLAQIAEREYGTPDGWKEIAVLNGIKVPATVSAGTTLNLSPKNLEEYSFEVAAAPVDAEPKDAIDQEIDQLENQIASMETEIDDIAKAKAPAIGNVAVAPEPPATQLELQQRKKLASVEMNGGFIRQNLALILFIAGLGTFLLFYFFVKKSKDLGGDF